jgi:AraC family transcriptional regulator
MAMQKLMKAADLETHGAALRVAPVAVHGSSVEKYGSTGVLASSADRGWSGLSAQLRTHSNGVIAWKNTQPDTEICVAIRGSRSVITRQGGGIFDRTVAERGTIWRFVPPACRRITSISPILCREFCISIFRQATSRQTGVDLDKPVIASLRYENGFQDPLVAEIAYAIVSELQTETPAGRLLAETLACSLAARLVQNHLSSSPAQASHGSQRKGLIDADSPACWIT